MGATSITSSRPSFLVHAAIPAERPANMERPRAPGQARSCSANNASRRQDEERSGTFRVLRRALLDEYGVAARKSAASSPCLRPCNAATALPSSPMAPKVERNPRSPRGGVPFAQAAPHAGDEPRQQ